MDKLQEAGGMKIDTNDKDEEKLKEIVRQKDEQLDSIAADQILHAFTMDTLQEDLLSLESWKSADEYQVNSTRDNFTRASAREKDKKSSTLADVIIKALIAKRRKAIIDQEDAESDLVSYETSEKRIMILASILAVMLCVINSLLLTLVVTNQHQTNILVLDSTLDGKHMITKQPYVVLLFNDGQLEFFSLNGTQLNLAWSFKVPKVTDQTGYFPYVRKNTLNIIYTDGKKDVTVISGKTQHFTIKKSKIPQEFFYTAKSTHFGNQVWILGGNNKKDTETIYGQNCNYQPNHNTMIWNTRKHRYYPGPSLPDNDINEGCPVALNRTHALILFQSYDTNSWSCIKGWIYDFEETKWTKSDICYYNMTIGCGYYYNNIDLSCTETFGKKTGNKIFVMVQEASCVNVICSKREFLIIDLQSKSTMQIQNPLMNRDKTESQIRSIDLLSIQDMVFLFSTTSEGMVEKLQVHLLQNETLIDQQSIQVKPYLANNGQHQIVNAKDFSTIPLLF